MDGSAVHYVSLVSGRVVVRCWWHGVLTYSVTFDPKFVQIEINCATVKEYYMEAKQKKERKETGKKNRKKRKTEKTKKNPSSPSPFLHVLPSDPVVYVCVPKLFT